MIRVRLEFNQAFLSSAHIDQGLQRCWCRPNVHVTSISDFAHQLVQEFHLAGVSANDLQLVLDGFTLPSTSPIDFLRDGDYIFVQNKAGTQLGSAAGAPAPPLPWSSNNATWQLPWHVVPDQQQHESAPHLLQYHDQPPAGPISTDPPHQPTPGQHHQPTTAQHHQPTTAQHKRKQGGSDQASKRAKKGQQQQHPGGSAQVPAATSQQHPAHAAKPSIASAQPPEAIAHANGALPAAVPSVAPVLAATGVAGASGSEGGVKKPSRSARRKATKRKLRRIGLLPYGKSAPAKGQHQAGHAQPLQRQQRQQGGQSSGLQLALTAPPLNPNTKGRPAAQQQQSRQGATAAMAGPGTSAAANNKPPAAAANEGTKSSSSEDSSTSESGSGSEQESTSESGSESEPESSSGSESSSSSSSEEEESSSASESSSSEESSSSSEGESSSDGEEDSTPQGAQPASTLAAASAKPLPNGNAAGPSQATGSGTQRVQGLQQQQRPRHQQQHMLVPSAAEFAQLPVLDCVPAAGDVLGYTILEIGVDFTPQVSEVRYGKVQHVEGGSLAEATVTLAPWPAPHTHPLRSKIEEWRAENTGEDEDETELDYHSLPFVGAYQPDGILVTCLSELMQVRVVHGPGTGSQPAAGPGQHQHSGAAGSRAEPRQQHQRLPGPPPLPGHVRPASSAPPAPTPTPATPAPGGPTTPSSSRAPPGHVISAVGGWADVAEQLRRRRQELVVPGTSQQPLALPPPPPLDATMTPGRMAPRSGAQHTVTWADSQQQQQQPPAASGAPVNMPGAVRPRGGIKRTAVGPLLNMLRARAEAQGQQT